jgi:Transmembrane domain of unknown function (DUF3566)
MPADTSGVTTGAQDQGTPGPPGPATPTADQGKGGSSAPTVGGARPDGDGNGSADGSRAPGGNGPSSGAATAPPASRPGTESGSGVPDAPILTPAPSVEPPPPPVLVPQEGALRRRGRHLQQARADRASRRGLRVNQRLWSIDVWSVLKISALFYVSLGLIILVAVTLLYNAGRSVGTVDQVESFVTRMGAYGDCVPRPEVPEGTEFEADDDCAEGEVLVGGFRIDDGTLFKAAAIGGAILVLAGSIGNVLLTILINLLNELTGGLRHTIIKEPVRRPASGSQRRRSRR